MLFHSLLRVTDTHPLMSFLSPCFVQQAKAEAVLPSFILPFLLIYRRLGGNILLNLFSHNFSQ